METQALTLIREMILLTKQSKLVWSREQESGHFEAKLAGRCFRVEFIYLMRTDEVGADRTIARLGVPGLLFDYSIGTEGFDLVCEMLAFGDPTWMEARERGQKKFTEVMAFLQQMRADRSSLAA